MDAIARALDWTVENIGNVYFFALAAIVAAAVVLVAVLVVASLV